MRTKRLMIPVLLVLALVWMAVPAVAQQCQWASGFERERAGMDIDVRALTVFDDGTGPALYAGGQFTMAGGVAARGIARWNGTQWSPLSSGMVNVFALTVFDDGTGPALYAGGNFIMAGGVAANGIAKWDGTQWSPLSSGMNGNGVLALTVFNDGTGPALYAGGSFTTAGGVAARGIARWNGTQWSPLGSEMGGGVLALTVFDDGAGPALYAGGLFSIAGAISIAKWDGTQWSPLGSGVNSVVYALTVFDDGTGPALYAGGLFTMAGGVAANRIAKWDGTQWSPLGSGLNSNIEFALTVFDDGTGPALYAGGQFTMAGGVAANRIAKWDGTQWSALGSGMNNTVFALTVFDDGTGPALYAGGFFTMAGDIPSSFIAAWRCAVP